MTPTKKTIGLLGAVLLAGLLSSSPRMIEPVFSQTKLPELENKNAHERAAIKGDIISKQNVLGRFTEQGLLVEIIGIRKFEKGIEVYAQAWKNGTQLGFGKEGAIETERFLIYNPPVLVDDPNGNVVREWDDRNGIHHIVRLKFDPKAALRESLAEIIKSVGKEGTKIKKGSVGNTTSTFYPAAGTGGGSTDGTVYGAGVSFADARASGGTGTFETATEETAAGIFPGFMYRAIFTFDTSAIPDTDTINSATFVVYNYNNSGTPPEIGLIETTPADTDDIDAGDYDAPTADGFTEGADREAPSAGNELTFTLDVTGLTFITKTGVTSLGLRSAWDLDNSANTGDHQFQIRWADYAGTTNDPRLVVVHEAGAAAAGVNQIIFIN